MKEEMKKVGRDWQCKEPNKLYQRKNMSLEYYAVEGGIRVEILGLRKEGHAMC
jgi:hypothetical protein